ncbi:uncharacterized protein LOC105420553 [Amborella trichopoda]|uniref:uncharacterized protein LOC105420553 n=1 Tax=Amborella trichopoda TaxID=13333 RepID=UPI0009BEFB6D|nr:uncharacterized protein LOC105420553 [Amborella trichopoda]|eukprot:XP_020520032.1 uncharacterized protein LOC105420553 [Amborella trichopoda]
MHAHTHTRTHTHTQGCVSLFLFFFSGRFPPFLCLILQEEPHCSFTLSISLESWISLSLSPIFPNFWEEPCYSFFVSVNLFETVDLPEFRRPLLRVHEVVLAIKVVFKQFIRPYLAKEILPNAGKASCLIIGKIKKVEDFLHLPVDVKLCLPKKEKRTWTSQKKKTETLERKKPKKKNIACKSYQRKISPSRSRKPASPNN